MNIDQLRRYYSSLRKLACDGDASKYKDFDAQCAHALEDADGPRCVVMTERAVLNAILALGDAYYAEMGDHGDDASLAEGCREFVSHRIEDAFQRALVA